MSTLISPLRFATDRTALTEALIDIEDVTNAVYNFRLEGTECIWNFYDLQGQEQEGRFNLLAALPVFDQEDSLVLHSQAGRLFWAVSSGGSGAGLPPYDQSEELVLHSQANRLFWAQPSGGETPGYRKLTLVNRLPLCNTEEPCEENDVVILNQDQELSLWYYTGPESYNPTVTRNEAKDIKDIIFLNKSIRNLYSSFTGPNLLFTTDNTHLFVVYRANLNSLQFSGGSWLIRRFNLATGIEDTSYRRWIDSRNMLGAPQRIVILNGHIFYINRSSSSFRGLYRIQTNNSITLLTHFLSNRNPSGLFVRDGKLLVTISDFSGDFHYQHFSVALNGTITADHSLKEIPSSLPISYRRGILLGSFILDSYMMHENPSNAFTAYNLPPIDGSDINEADTAPVTDRNFNIGSLITSGYSLNTFSRGYSNGIMYGYETTAQSNALVRNDEIDLLAFNLKTGGWQLGFEGLTLPQSSKAFEGEGPPPIQLGINGEFYYDTVGKVAYIKANGKWEILGDLSLAGFPEKTPVDSDKFLLEDITAHTEAFGEVEAANNKVITNRASISTTAGIREARIFDGHTFYLNSTGNLTIVNNNSFQQTFSGTIGVGGNSEIILQRNIAGANPKEVLIFEKEHFRVVSRRFNAAYTSGDFDTSRVRDVNLFDLPFGPIGQPHFSEIDSATDGTTIYVILTPSNTLMNIYAWKLADGTRDNDKNILNIHFAEGEADRLQSDRSKAILINGKILYSTQDIDNEQFINRIFVIDVARKERDSELDFTLPKPSVPATYPFLAVEGNRFFVQWQFSTSAPNRQTWYAFNGIIPGIEVKKFSVDFDTLAKSVLAKGDHSFSAEIFSFNHGTNAISSWEDLLGKHTISVLVKNAQNIPVKSGDINIIFSGFITKTLTPKTIEDGLNVYTFELTSSDVNTLDNNLGTQTTVDLEIQRSGVRLARHRFPIDPTFSGPVGIITLYNAADDASAVTSFTIPRTKINELDLEFVELHVESFNMIASIKLSHDMEEPTDMSLTSGTYYYAKAVNQNADRGIALRVAKSSGGVTVDIVNINQRGQISTASSFKIEKIYVKKLKETDAT